LIKFLVFSFTLFLSSGLLACPYCAGNSQGGKDSNTTLVLALFILSIYIPYYLILRLIKKQKALALAVKEAHDNPGSANA
jgi:hypothetical protein